MKQDVFNRYADKVVELFSIDRDALFSKSKKRELVDARHLLYYLCSKRPMRVNYIQRYMSENGYEITHSSIIHGINVMKRKMAEDPDYIKIVNKLNTSNYGN